MPDSFALGLAAVLAAGFFQGGFMAPSKWIRGWAWENYWLLFAITAYLIAPWVLAIATIPHLDEVYRRASPGALATIALFGVAWGIGAITFGLGVDALGLALGFAVILGLATTFGTLIPLLVTPPANLSSGKLALICAALAVMLAGVAVCSWAGKWKEQAGARSYRRGLLICAASGILSACGNLGFVFGSEITTHAKSLGVSDSLAGNALWTLLTFPLFLCNGGFAFYKLSRNGTASQFRHHTTGNGLLAVTMGVMWMAGMGLYGVGSRTMGALSPSLGWALLMSSMVLVANLFGFVTGEWSAAPASARRQLVTGLGVLLLAIALLGYTNSLP